MTRNVVSMDAREADHRFANHLALLAGFVRLKAADLARQPVEPTTDGVQLLLEGVRAQIEAIADLHRSLASGSRFGRADLKEQLHKVCAPFSSLVGGRIALIEDVSPDCQVSPDRVLPVTQIVSEIITNAIKHAYPPGQSGTILVRGRADEAGTIVIEILDEGPGFPEGFDARSNRGLGFVMVGALAKQLGGRVEFDSEHAGLRFRLTLPSEGEPFRGCRR